MKTKLFKQYYKLLQKRSHHYSKFYNIDYIVVEGQAIEIFVKAIDSYDDTKTNFSTHLYYKLKELQYFCRKEYKYRKKTESFEIFSNVINNLYNYTPEYRVELEDSISTELNKECGNIVMDLINGKFSYPKQKHSKRFSKQELMRTYKYNSNSVEIVWNTIKMWWQNYEKNYLSI